LEELARLRENDGARREVLDRASFSMLHRPALGGQLIARICATEETAPELELLTELLGSGLDAARIARENRKKRGSAFLQTVADAVAMASGQDRLSPFHRLRPRSIGCFLQAPGPGTDCPHRQIWNCLQ